MDLKETDIHKPEYKIIENTENANFLFQSLIHILSGKNYYIILQNQCLDKLLTFSKNLMWYQIKFCDQILYQPIANCSLAIKDLKTKIKFEHKDCSSFNETKKIMTSIKVYVFFLSYILTHA